MDQRTLDHARKLADHSVNIESGDHVLISAPPVAGDLVAALHEVLGARDAIPLTLTRSGRALRRYLKASTAEGIETPRHELAAFRAADAVIGIDGAVDKPSFSGVANNVESAYEMTRDAIWNEMMNKRWAGTQYPAPRNAELAGMSVEAYEDFVYDAILVDWEQQRHYQVPLANRLTDAETLRIVSGQRTDIRMEITEMQANNDFGRRDLPGGEVFTAPNPDSVEGTVHFDVPARVRGNDVRNLELEFQAGMVTDFEAVSGESAVASLLRTDQGAKRVGEIGIGMHPEIDRITMNTLFDEKMEGTVHLALGSAYESTVPTDRKRNESTVHQDFIIDMRSNSRLELDGEVVFRDGTFVDSELVGPRPNAHKE